MGFEIKKERHYIVVTCYITIFYLTVPIRRPYVPALLFGPGAGLTIFLYNVVLDLTAYIKTMVPNTVLGSTVRIKNTVLGSTLRAINTVFVDL